MTSQRTVLVTGATGKQGRALIDCLLNLPSPLNEEFNILAMVRDPSAAGARALSQKPRVSLIQGDLSNPETVFQQHEGPIWGVYSVQVNSDAEQTQGIALVDAAAKHNVRHFVQSSGDRGGPEKSDIDATNVKNFQMKFAIEQRLKQACQVERTSNPMTYTILRPVTFMENQSTDRHGMGFGRMWMQMQDGDRKLMLISTRDIGWFGAQAFAYSESAEYRNQALSIAGDELTAKEAEKIFQEVTGKKMPLAPCIVGKGLKFILSDTLGDMFTWFEKEGYSADIAACKKANPNMLDYRTWLQNYSGFV